MTTSSGRDRSAELGPIREVTSADVSVRRVASSVLRVEGLVVLGDRRGRALGYPTANVEVSADTLLPEDGVYAGWFWRENGDRHLAAVSVGTRPTYYGADGSRLVEAYLLDFDGDLYGERVSIELRDRIRGQAAFASSEDLVAEMSSDVARVRELCGS